MNKLTFLMALLALIMGGVAYWRSGGQQDIAKARQEFEQKLEEIRAQQEELSENASDTTRAAYESLRDRIKRAGDRLTVLRKDATADLRKQIDLAASQLKKLDERVARGLEQVDAAPASEVRETAEALTKRVRRLEARIALLESKSELQLALASVKKKDFDQTREHLGEAASLTTTARQTLDDDFAYDAGLDAVVEGLRQAVAAVKEQAPDSPGSIVKVTKATDALLSDLESDERAAEGAKRA